MKDYTLKIQNDYSWLLTEDRDIKDILWDTLRVREKGYFHSALYKQGIWDGYLEFFKKDGGRFLTGLLPDVLKVLHQHKIVPKIVETRKFFEWKTNTIDKHYLSKFTKEKVELYDYQIDAVNEAIKNYRGIVKLPTGAGKTFVLISIMKSLPEKFPLLFLTKGVSLVEQNYDEMKKWGVKNVGRIYGKYKEPNFITCATTAKASLEKLEPIIGKFKGLIIDEAHECMSPVPRKTFKKMDDAVLRIGISATPFKDGGKDLAQKMYLKGYFGSILRTKNESGEITTQDLQNRQILSKSDCYFSTVKHPQIPHEPYIDAVTLGIAENIQFAQKVSDLATSLDGRTLILVDRIKQGELLMQFMPNAHWIQGMTDLEERSKIFNELKHGTNVIAIVMQRIVSAGINVFIHNLVNAAGGKAEHNIIQRFGRGLRTAQDKEQLKYYDFIFDINDYLFKHSMERIKTLEKEGHIVRMME